MYNYFKDKFDISQNFRLKNIDETKNYFIKKTNQNQLISKKPKKVCKALNYIEHFFFLVSTVTGSISISSFASLIGISTSNASLAVGIKAFVITAVIKK